MKINLRVKKYLKVTSFLSSRMMGLALCSQGRRMLTPKLFSGPAPSCPACMIPPPAPVMTMKPASAILRPKLHGLLVFQRFGVRARGAENRHLADRRKAQTG